MLSKIFRDTLKQYFDTALAWLVGKSLAIDDVAELAGEVQNEFVAHSIRWNWRHAALLRVRLERRNAALAANYDNPQKEDLESNSKPAVAASVQQQV
jgi:hypothetical protein